MCVCVRVPLRLVITEQRCFTSLCGKTCCAHRFVQVDKWFFKVLPICVEIMVAPMVAQPRFSVQVPSTKVRLWEDRLSGVCVWQERPRHPGLPFRRRGLRWDDSKKEYCVFPSVRKYICVSSLMIFTTVCSFLSSRNSLRCS